MFTPPKLTREQYVDFLDGKINSDDTPVTFTSSASAPVQETQQVAELFDLMSFLKRLYCHIPRCIVGHYDSKSRREEIREGHFFSTEECQTLELKKDCIILFVYDREHFLEDLEEEEKEENIACLQELAVYFNLPVVIDQFEWVDPEFNDQEIGEALLRQNYLSSLNFLDQHRPALHQLAKEHWCINSSTPLLGVDDQGTILIGTDHFGISLEGESEPPSSLPNGIKLKYLESKVSFAASDTIGVGDNIFVKERKNFSTFKLGLTFSKDGQNYGLTAAHPFLASRLKLQPDIADKKIFVLNSSSDPIGAVEWAEKMPQVSLDNIEYHADVAIFLLTAALKKPPTPLSDLKLLTLDNLNEKTAIGEKLLVSSRPNNLGVITTSNCVDLYYPGGGESYFLSQEPLILKGQLLISVENDSSDAPFCQGGDSGSVLYSKDSEILGCFTGIQTNPDGSCRNSRRYLFTPSLVLAKKLEIGISSNDGNFSRFHSFEASSNLFSLFLALSFFPPSFV